MLYITKSEGRPLQVERKALAAASRAVKEEGAAGGGGEVDELEAERKVFFFFFFFFTLVTGPRRSFSLKLSDTRVSMLEGPCALR